MCISHQGPLCFYASAPEEASASTKEKVSSSWVDVQDWRNAIDGFDCDLLHLDGAEFGQSDFDPYAPE
eukprot:571162-Rhodomonas_salina.3